MLYSSFDPPHRGHEWLLEQALERYGHAVALAPLTHFHKRVLPGCNAPLELRLRMLLAIRERLGPGLTVGLSAQPYYLRLADALQDTSGARRIRLLLGTDGFGRLRGSRRYFRANDLAWGVAQQARCNQLARDALVFDRYGRSGTGLVVPERVRGLSSTAVRSLAAGRVRRGASALAQEQALLPWVSAEVAGLLVAEAPYRGAPCELVSSRGEP